MCRSGSLGYDAPVRIALVSPYSYTYPGGVGRHVEALAEELIRQGHDVRLLAPYDPDDRLASIAHRGARPEARPAPDYFISLGRSVGVPANGAVSNVTFTPYAASMISRELRHGDYDVVHVHEPNGAMASCFTIESAHTPLVGTFHTYSTGITNRLASSVLGMRRLYNKLHVRIAVSEAARWTAQRFNGGSYRVIPNGVHLDAPPAGPKPPSESGELRLLFLGRAEERKGLPVLLRAFEALQGVGVPARLTVAGATAEEVEPYLLDVRGVEVLGRVTDDEKWRLLHEADLLCAPSLGGESFGMVLTEAFAAGTPVVASDIAGYRDVARDGVDGVLVPAGDPAALGEALHDLALDPERRERMGECARERAQRFAWEHVAAEVVDAYRDAIDVAAAAEPSGRRERLALRTGLANADGGPRGRPTRLPSPEPAAPGDGRRRAWRIVRRGAVVGGAVGGVGLAALALQRIGIESIGNALLGAQTFWVFAALALMCTSMLLRAESWHAILRAALPGVRVRRRDAARGIMIGVLMSATLPARLGEPSRALIVARRLGRVRERLPVVLGTIVSQTLLNIVALVILGTIMFATVGL
ncbi:MAG: phosphatidyl-myo-inositol alpha-mannosyltransferase, partial [Thermoleophilaceae bacterium]|nr:phosphatidyl-myo-inositol alpha-mannosyltransferase [Thermoleophilaceae bacterium]